MEVTTMVFPPKGKVVRMYKRERTAVMVEPKVLLLLDQWPTLGQILDIPYDRICVSRVPHTYPKKINLPGL